MFPLGPRLIATILALVSIGLLASLLPRTSFVSQSSGAFVDAIGPVWPGHSVEQALGDVPGVISEVRIWAAAGSGQGEAPIVASLLDEEGGEPVRQVRARIQERNVPGPYVLVFPPYQPSSGEELVLQLSVSTERENHVMFGTSEPGPAVPPLTVNHQATDQGPLAHDLIWKGRGLRAAVAGSIQDLARLAGAIAAALMALALQPVIARSLRTMAQKALDGLRIAVRPVRRMLSRVHRSAAARARHDTLTTTRRGFYVFPWLIPAFAILHYLANNLLIFRVSEAIAVAVVTMATATITFLALRFVFKTAAVAAVLTGLLGIAFFSYGHIYVALGDRADDRYLLGLALPVVLGLGALMCARPELARRVGFVLNFGSLALVAAPTYQIALVFLSANSPQAAQLSQDLPGIDERVAEAKAKFSRNELRDIYYIILDEYPRSGSPESFDNSAFVGELESRGFYVDPQARSNYTRSNWSIPSSLTMEYVDEFPREDKVALRHILKRAIDHTLGRILKSLGYKYVHVSSGWLMTKTSRNADVIVDFSPSGRLLAGVETQDPFTFQRASRLSNRFTTTFLRTTAARPFLSHDFSTEYDDPHTYTWKHPYRTLAWLDFMTEVGMIEGPKFVFAHLMKPHEPHSFDQYGNITFDEIGWSDDHDPTVSKAFYGQVIYINARMLEVIDAILANYEEPPIMVIAGDHGNERSNPSISNDILAAYLLPDGGESGIYPSITSVNSFRAILDYYFGLNLGLLEDKVYHLGS